MEQIKLPCFFNKVKQSKVLTQLEQTSLQSLDINDKYDFIKDGEYFWGFLISEEDMKVFVKDGGYYYISGNWEGSFNSNSFIFIEKINKPKTK